MTSEEKRVYLLLKSVIYYYHGLDELEKTDLEKASQELDAAEELAWALAFVAEDYITAFDRARNFLSHVIGDYAKEKRVSLIDMVWQSNNVKGYVTEMEATAMFKLARDWNVEKELVELVLK